MTSWPPDGAALVAEQRRLAAEADAARHDESASVPSPPLLGGCFIAYARGEAGPGHPGDHAWAAAVTWRPTGEPRDEGAALRGTSQARGPRVAADTEEQTVVAGTVPASYEPGLLALREGPLLERAVRSLRAPPDVLLVDATGLDHPRRAGLAIHLGRVVGLPTVGVTHRPLHARGAAEPAGRARGTRAAVSIDDEVVGYWVVTRDAARPVLAHAGWRTDAEQAADIVLLASTPSSRTPVPLGEARRVAREARELAGHGR